jgi:hypothetical protein
MVYMFIEVSLLKFLKAKSFFLVKIGGRAREVKWWVKVIAIGVETGKF